MENPFLEQGEKYLHLLSEFFESKSYQKPKYLLALGLVIISFFYHFLISPPANFPVKSIVSISEGENLNAVSSSLKEQHIIRTALGFRVIAYFLGADTNMKAGNYYLDKPENTITLVWRVLNSDRRLETVKITIPEGFTNEEIINLFDKRFQKFNHEEFLKLAPQGFMFPDTYFIDTGASASSTIQLLKNNFNKKINPLLNDINSSGHTFKEIIIMASIIEAEAKAPDEMATASGILWKRLKIGMPLQVDSAMSTYSSGGLPLEPIDNPGLVSIKAALYPKQSPYLYFLTDKNGVMHYAKTFDEHKANKAKYLNR